MSIFEINKENLIYNVNKIKKRLSENVKFCAMVKADAYGHCAKVISKIIEPYVDYFGVATINEGIELRRNGCFKRIICVGKVFESEFKKASSYDIEIMIEDYNSLVAMQKLNLTIKVHLKIDLGMHRLGFNDKSIFKESIKFVKKQKDIKIVGVFSHFSTSDKDFYMEKKKIFDEYIKLLSPLKNKVIVHCSNSLASAYKSLQYDMVRVGLSIYGYGEKGLKKVLTIKSKVISIRKVEKGEYVGYNKGYKSDSNCIIATVFLGYYDGVNRKLANNCYVSINGRKYLVVGNICMDMFMVKIDESVSVGDDVIVCDDADYWASIIKTIPYEVLTSFKYQRMQIKIV